jgi:hypothetical protein
VSALAGPRRDVGCVGHGYSGTRAPRLGFLNDERAVTIATNVDLSQKRFHRFYGICGTTVRTGQRSVLVRVVHWALPGGKGRRSNSEEDIGLQDFSSTRKASCFFAAFSCKACLLGGGARDRGRRWPSAGGRASAVRTAHVANRAHPRSTPHDSDTVSDVRVRRGAGLACIQECASRKRTDQSARVDGQALRAGPSHASPCWFYCVFTVLIPMTGVMR